MAGSRTVLIPTAVAMLICGATIVPGQENQEGSADKPSASSESVPPAKAKPESRQYTPEEIIEAFEKDRPVNRPVTRRSDTGISGAVPPDRNLRPDGDYVRDMTGRISQDGEWWVFHFRSDSTSLEMPPVRLLPNQQLERIVREQKATSEQLQFVVSGEMTLYNNSNYLLLRKALRRQGFGNLQD